MIALDALLSKLIARVVDGMGDNGVRKMTFPEITVLAKRMGEIDTEAGAGYLLAIGEEIKEDPSRLANSCLLCVVDHRRSITNRKNAQRDDQGGIVPVTVFPVAYYNGRAPYRNACARIEQGRLVRLGPADDDTVHLLVTSKLYFWSVLGLLYIN